MQRCDPHLAWQCVSCVHGLKLTRAIPSHSPFTNRLRRWLPWGSLGKDAVQVPSRAGGEAARPSHTNLTYTRVHTYSVIFKRAHILPLSLSHTHTQTQTPTSRDTHSHAHTQRARNHARTSTGTRGQLSHTHTYGTGTAAGSAAGSGDG